VTAIAPRENIQPTTWPTNIFSKGLKWLTCRGL